MCFWTNPVPGFPRLELCAENLVDGCELLYNCDFDRSTDVTETRARAVVVVTTGRPRGT
jgi:hypothetical protein